MTADLRNVARRENRTRNTFITCKTQEAFPLKTNRCQVTHSLLFLRGVHDPSPRTGVNSSVVKSLFLYDSLLVFCRCFCYYSKANLVHYCYPPCPVLYDIGRHALHCMGIPVFGMGGGLGRNFAARGLYFCMLLKILRSLHICTMNARYVKLLSTLFSEMTPSNAGGAFGCTVGVLL